MFKQYLVLSYINYVSNKQSRHQDDYCCCSVAHSWLFATPWTAASYISLSITIPQSLLRTHVHWMDDAIQASHSLLSPSSPALNLCIRRGWDKLREWHWCVYTTMCTVESWWEVAVWHREPNLVLCDNIKGWDEGEVGTRIKRRGVYIVMTDSPCCMAETNTIL